MTKKTIRSAITTLLLVGIFAANLVSAHAIQIEPRYTGISDMVSSLTVSSNGGAKCTGRAEVRSGYTVDLTVELKQDGTSIKEWTSSGSGTVSAGGTYYVMSGHDYVVTTTVEVYDSRGNVVDNPSKDSLTSFY